MLPTVTGPCASKVLAKMGSAARERAEEHSLDRHLEEIIDLYREVVRSKRQLGVVSAGTRSTAPPPPSAASKRGLRCANDLMRYEALAAFEAHRACVEGGPGDLMKNASRTRVSLVGDPERGRRLGSTLSAWWRVSTAPRRRRSCCASWKGRLVSGSRAAG